MVAVPGDIKLLIRAVVSSKDGGVLENQFRSDFRKIANAFFEHQKYGFRSVKELMMSMPDVVRVEYDKKHNMDRYLGVPKPGQFLSKSAQKAMRIHGSDSDGGSSRARRRRSYGDSGGKKLDGTYDVDCKLSHRGVRDLKRQLIDSQNDKGYYALCFPVELIGVYGEGSVKLDFNSVGEVADENRSGRFSFVRYKTVEEAQRAVEKLAEKYDIRVPAEKGKKEGKSDPVPTRISGPQNKLTLAAKPDPDLPIATDHDLDSNLPTVCIRNLPADTPTHILMRELGVPPDCERIFFSKKFKQSFAFVAFPDDDRCGSENARRFVKNFQGCIIGGKTISLSIVSGTLSSDDSTSEREADTIDMDSVHSWLIDEAECAKNLYHNELSVNTNKTIADDDSPVISCQIGSFRYGQPDGAESDFQSGSPTSDVEYHVVPPGLEMGEPPGLEDDGMSDVGSSVLSDIPIRLKLSDFPYHTTTEELLTILRPFGVDCVRIINNNDFYHSTKAQVEVNMYQAHRIIQALDDSVFKNRSLRVTPDNSSKLRMLQYARNADPNAFPETVPTLFQSPKLDQLMSECGTFKFLRDTIDVRMRMPIYVTHIERDNNDYIWAVRTIDFTGLTALDNHLQTFRSDRRSHSQRGIIRDRAGMWHRVWVNLVLPDDFLYVISIDRGRPFTIKREDYMYLPDGHWNSEKPFVMPIKICERRRPSMKIVPNHGIYHVQPVDLVENILYVVI